jgi:PKD domain
MRVPTLLSVFFWASCLAGQTPLPPQHTADFSAVSEGDGMRFRPQCSPLTTTPGAPPAFYTYLWEFGDGTFSKEESPLHVYQKTGEYEVAFHATNHYDNGKPPRKKQKKTVVNTAREAYSGLTPDAFDLPTRAVALKANREAKAEEELTCVFSYRNVGKMPSDGRLFLFFNEKKYAASHFTFESARVHHGETTENRYGRAETAPNAETEAWTGLRLNTHPLAAVIWNPWKPAVIVEQMLSEARGAFRAEHSWRFQKLEPGAKRNLFVTLLGTASMIKDTSAILLIRAVFAPDDPVLSPEVFDLKLEIVASHDPNLIAVSDNRVNYRTLGQKKMDYTVRFQNNGEGPAKKVELTVEIPDGLNLAKMRPLEWYPKCPICSDKKPVPGCLDTLFEKNKLVFVFNNIYLPGSRQKNISDYDSTKGFVRYRIDPEKGMPKRAFRSRAKIVFDKNPPIYTNFSKTRFKPGLSPGFKLGYGFRPDSIGQGYSLMGLSLSPYKSWKIYPQIELLTGIKGRTGFPESTSRDTIKGKQIDAQGGLARVDTVRQTTRSGNRGFVSAELPVLLRKNFSRWIGVGLGGSARVFFDNGEIIQSGQNKHLFYRAGKLVKEEVQETKLSKMPVSGTRVQYTVFADLALGLVRAGPSFGIRAGGLLNDGFSPFVQAAFELKF